MTSAVARAAQAVAAASKQRPPIGDRIGVLRIVALPGPVQAWSVDVVNVLAEPITVPFDRWSSAFIADITANGRALNGRRVKVEFIEQQAYIAYTVGG